MVARDLAAKVPISDYSRLRRAPRSNPHAKDLGAKASSSFGATAALTTVSSASVADMIVTDITWSPASPVPGDHVVFTATVQNIGAVATPAATIVDVLFTVSDATLQQVGGRSWSDNNSTSLAAGASRAQTANGGDTSGWIVAGPVGSYTVQAYVNGNSRFPEADRLNNFLNEQFAVAITATAPTAPQNLAATPGNSIVSTTWDFPASDGGSPVTGYKLYRNTVLITSLDDAIISYDDTTAVNGVTYTYTISAINSVGEGVQSSGVVATPFAATGAPALPANQLVGQASYKALSFGGNLFVNIPISTINTWKTWGFFGAATGNVLAGYMVEAINGSGQLISEVPNTPGSAYDWQRAHEGRAVASVNGNQAGFGIVNYQKTNDPNYEAYIKFYVASASNRVQDAGAHFPATFDPWDDAKWNTAATWFGLFARDLKNNLGGSGITFDPEPGPWDKLGPGRTQAEQDQKVHDRAYQCGQAYFQAWPDAKVFVYQWTHGGYYDVLGYYAAGDTTSKPATRQGSWFLGWLKAMCDFGGPQSRFMAMDAGFYTWGEGGAGGPSVDARSGKLKLNCERSMACMSQPYPMGVGSTSWSQGCERIRFIPAGWPGPSAGGRATPNSTLPAEWAAQEAVDREWSMGEWRCVYHGPADAAAGGTNGTPAGQWYGTPAAGGTVYGHGTTHLAGNQAAANPAPIPTVLPTCTNLSWTGSTLTCRAAHKYGVICVKVYNGNGFNSANPEPSYLGAMTMSWGHPSLPDYVGTPAKSGGNATASYPTAQRVADSYQQCTFTRAGASGDWLVLKVVTAKLDEAWFEVQHP